MRNPSFEDPGWETLKPLPGTTTRNQRPRHWQLRIIAPGEDLFDSQDKATGWPECVHKLAHQLPPDEQLGGENALILDGAVCYKTFGSAAFGVELTQVLDGLPPGATVRFAMNAIADRHGHLDPYGIEIGAWAGEWTGAWRHSIPHREYRSYEVAGVVGPDGTLEVGIRAKSKWDVDVDLFFDAGSAEVVGPGPPPDPVVYDLARFVLPSDRRVVRLAYDIDGQTGRQLVQVQAHPTHPAVWLIVKDGQWERLYLSGDYICRDCDTSEAADRYYRPVTDGRFGAVWCKRHMKVGERTQQANSVVHYWKDDCSVRITGGLPGELLLESVGPYDFRSGLAGNNVMTLAWLVGGAVVERYRYAPTLGLVGWWGEGRGESWLHEILPDSQPDLTPETIACIPDPVDLYQPDAPPPEIPVVLFSQRDPRWKGEPLGFSQEYTIGGAGCALTCAAMLAATIDPTVTPSTLNRRMKELDGFDEDARIKWNVLERAVPGMDDQGATNWTGVPANMGQFYAALAGGPVVTHVDFVPATSKLDHHFVVAIEAANGDLVIADPWDGAATRLLQRYAEAHWDLARAVYGMRLLRAGDAQPVPIVRVIAEGLVNIIVER